MSERPTTSPGRALRGPFVLVVALLALALLGWAALRGVGPSSGTIASVPRERGVGPLASEVPASPARRGKAPAPRVPLEDSPADSTPTAEVDPKRGLAERVARLEARLAEQDRELRALRHRVATLESAELTAEVEQARAAKPETDWVALLDYADRWRLDEQAARVELTLLGEAEVLARFGPPTNTWPTGEGMTWLYGDRWDPVSETYAREVYLVFAHGRMAKVYVDVP